MEMMVVEPFGAIAGLHADECLPMGIKGEVVVLLAGRVRKPIRHRLAQFVPEEIEVGSLVCWAMSAILTAAEDVFSAPIRVGAKLRLGGQVLEIGVHAVPDRSRVGPRRVWAQEGLAQFHCTDS